MARQASVQKQIGYQAPAVHKAFQLLRVVAATRRRIGVTDLARELGYSKSTTHGLIHALLREGALAQDHNGRGLFLGPAVADLAFSGWNFLKMTELAQPFIDKIRDYIGQSVFLGVLIGERVMIMATAEAADTLRISASPGATISLFTGAVGKVFLAGKKSGEAVQLIEKKKLPSHTSRSIVDEKSYLAELERVRAKGYAIDDEEYLTGIRAVAVALRNQKGPPLAVWAVGLSSSMEQGKIQHVIDFTTEIAEELRRAMDEYI